MAQTIILAPGIDKRSSTEFEVAPGEVAKVSLYAQDHGGVTGGVRVRLREVIDDDTSNSLTSLEAGNTSPTIIGPGTYFAERPDISGFCVVPHGVALESAEAQVQDTALVQTSDNATSVTVYDGEEATIEFTTVPLEAAATIESTALPDGLTLTDNEDGTATIDGTPTTLGVTAVTVTVTVGAVESTSTITITVAAPVIAVQQNLSWTGTLGESFPSHDLESITTGGDESYTTAIKSGGVLPAGLSLNTGTGAVTGTPTEIVTDKLVGFRVTDGGSYFGDTIISFTIGPPTIEVATDSIADPEEATAYSDTLTATGGTTSKTWTVIDGALPAGLTLTAGTGVIEGTPTGVEGDVYTFRVRATDTNGYTGEHTFVLTVGPEPA